MIPTGRSEPFRIVSNLFRVGGINLAAFINALFEAFGLRPPIRNSVTGQPYSLEDTNIPNAVFTGRRPGEEAEETGAAAGAPPTPEEEAPPEAAEPAAEPEVAAEEAAVINFVQAFPSGNPLEIYYRTADGETYGKREGTRSWRNNNPGNIMAGDYANDHGAIGADNGPDPPMAIFPDIDTGYQAQMTLLRSQDRPYWNLNIPAAIELYTDATGAALQNYINGVLEQTGLDRERLIGSLDDNELRNLVRAMADHEGWREGTDLVPPSRAAGEPPAAGQTAENEEPVSGKLAAASEDLRQNVDGNFGVLAKTVTARNGNEASDPAPGTPATPAPGNDG